MWGGGGAGHSLNPALRVLGRHSEPRSQHQNFILTARAATQSLRAPREGEGSENSTVARTELVREVRESLLTGTVSPWKRKPKVAIQYHKRIYLLLKGKARLPLPLQGCPVAWFSKHQCGPRGFLAYSQLSRSIRRAPEKATRQCHSSSVWRVTCLPARHRKRLQDCELCPGHGGARTQGQRRLPDPCSSLGNCVHVLWPSGKPWWQGDTHSRLDRASQAIPSATLGGGCPPTRYIHSQGSVPLWAEPPPLLREVLQ